MNTLCCSSSKCCFYLDKRRSKGNWMTLFFWFFVLARNSVRYCRWSVIGVSKSSSHDWRCKRRFSNSYKRSSSWLIDIFITFSRWGLFKLAFFNQCIHSKNFELEFLWRQSRFSINYGFFKITYFKNAIFPLISPGYVFIGFDYWWNLDDYWSHFQNYNTELWTGSRFSKASYSIIESRKKSIFTFISQIGLTVL